MQKETYYWAYPKKVGAFCLNYPTRVIDFRVKTAMLSMIDEDVLGKGEDMFECDQTKKVSFSGVYLLWNNHKRIDFNLWHIHT